MGTTRQLMIIAIMIICVTTSFAAEDSLVWSTSTSAAGSETLENFIKGKKFTTPASGWVGPRRMMWYCNFAAPIVDMDVKCAIYDLSEDLVDTTYVKTITSVSGGTDWYQFDFVDSTTTLSNSTVYYFTIWADQVTSGVADFKVTTKAGDSLWIDAEAYGAWPDPSDINGQASYPRTGPMYFVYEDTEPAAEGINGRRRRIIGTFMEDTARVELCEVYDNTCLLAELTARKEE